MCMQHVIDPTRAEAFGARMVEILNDGALALMISVGHRTGLFDTLARLPASTSAQVADAAGLHERYVREWLGALVTGRIVEYDPELRTYALPAEHAGFLTRAASPANRAASMQFLPVLGGVEDRIVECFRHGGGVPYEAYPRFHAVMQEESNQTVVAGLFEHILPLAHGLTAQLARGIEVLDVGCGSGSAVCELAAAFPASRFQGVDSSTESIARARAQAAERGLTNAIFEVGDAALIAGSYDLITAFDAIHDQAHPDRVLAAIRCALRADGLFLMQDIRGSSHLHRNLDHPIAPYLYTISCLHCMSVSLAAGGMGLGTMWGEETARRMLAVAGFDHVDVQRLPHDIINDYYLVR